MAIDVDALVEQVIQKVGAFADSDKKALHAAYRKAAAELPKMTAVERALFAKKAHRRLGEAFGLSGAGVHRVTDKRSRARGKPTYRERLNQRFQQVNRSLF